MIYTVTFNPAIDYVVRLDRPLEVGEVNRAAGEDCVLGGKGINVSGVLRELGCESVALGFVAGIWGWGTCSSGWHRWALWPVRPVPGWSVVWPRRGSGPTSSIWPRA